MQKLGQSEMVMTRHENFRYVGTVHVVDSKVSTHVPFQATMAGPTGNPPLVQIRRNKYQCTYLFIVNKKNSLFWTRTKISQAMLGRWHATARLPLIICCTLQFSMHKASIEVKGTSVHLEFFHKALNFIVEKLLFLGDHAVAGVACCFRRLHPPPKCLQDNSKYKCKLALLLQTYEFSLLSTVPQG